MSTTYREGRAPVEHAGPTAPLALDHDTGEPLGDIVAIVVKRKPVAPAPAKPKAKAKAAKRAPAKARRR